MDRRFDQITQILTRMESNQVSSKAQGKAVAMSPDIPSPIGHSSCGVDHSRPSGSQIPLSFCESRENLLKNIDMPSFDGLVLLGGSREWRDTFALGTFMDWNAYNSFL